MRLTLGYKINGAILITFLVIILIFLAFYIPYQEKHFAYIRENGEKLVSSLLERDQEALANEIIQGDTAVLTARLKQMMTVKDILLISAFDKSGKLLASWGQYPEDTRELPEINKFNKDAEIHYQKWHKQSTIIYTRKIQSAGERVGFVRIYLTQEFVKYEQRLSYLIFGCLWASILIVMLVLLNLLLYRMIICPIKSLSHVMDMMQAGRIAEYHYTKSNDEIRDLSDAFNRMSSDLAISYQELDSQKKQLQVTKKYLSNVIDSMPSILIGIDPDMKITQWNLQAEKITGLPPETAKGKTLQEVFPQIVDEMKNVQESMKDRTAKKDEDLTLELYDEKKFVDITVYPLIANGIDGAVIRIDDVTERKKAEDALQESEEKYRLVVDNAYEGIVIIQDGIIQFANPMTVEVSGYSVDELTKMHFTNLIEDEDKELTLSHYAARIAGRSAPKNYIFRIKNRYGEILWTEIRIVMITWEGRPATLNFMRDITQQKKTEEHLQQVQKLEAVGTLAGGIAHDFNNLLQAIQGYTQLLLLDEEKSRTSSRELEEILGAAKRGGELTRQLLTFSRKVESNLRPVNINIEIKKVEKLLSRTIPKMIEIHLNLAEDLYTVSADPGQMEQVIMNLALNAKDAMKEGGRILIETENVILDKEYRKTHLIEKAGEYVLLSFSDTGHGMNSDTLEHIFEPFFTTKKVGEGTGLGLAMVYGIIKSHNAAINCYSVPGKGTTFRIYLPAIESFKGSTITEAVEPPKGGTETILLVDDDEALRDVGMQILERFGYKVILASNGEEALEIYRDKQAGIDLVILDLIMPGMGGTKCLEEILKVNNKAKVIIASGYYLSDDKGAPSKTGAKGFVKKPYILESILQEVRKAIENS